MSGPGEPAWSSRPIVAAVGLGAEREPELVEALEASGVLVVGARCLSADQVEAAAATRRVEAALLGAGLYRLDAAVLERLRLPVVLLTDEPCAGRWPRRRGLVLLPLEADVAQVRVALAEALRGRTSEPMPLVRPRPRSASPLERAGHRRGQLVWVTKYLGSAGATTLATSVLVRSGRAVLVELDRGAVAAAYLDADQDRALHVVVKTAPSTPEAWDQVLAAEVQSIPGRDEAGLLAGTWRLEERAELAPAVVASLLEELCQRYDLVLVDLGLAGLPGAEAPLVEVVQAAADRILLVGSADVVGLWQTRAALQLLGDDERVEVVLTRYDRRRQYPLATITAQLRREPLAIIPYDYAACARAVDEGRPVALDGRSPAGRALTELADRLRAQPAAEDGRKPKDRPTHPRGPAAVRLLARWRWRRTPPAASAPPSSPPEAPPPVAEASVPLDMPEPATMPEAGPMLRARRARRTRSGRAS